MSTASSQSKPRRRLSLAECQRNLVHSKYDSAQTTPDNRRHWASADSMSANAGLPLNVRRTIRDRSRYEDANNGYFKGMSKTFVNYVIGKGPRLQMTLESTSDNRLVERKFRTWAKRVRLGKKIRTARKSQLVSGEAFIALVHNPAIRGDIKLDLRLIECDRVSSPAGSLDTDSNYVDGIRYDDHGNPLEYTVLKHHPGDLRASVGANGRNYETIKAEFMIHLFDWDRPEQSRGVSELASSLPLGAYLRRYTLAAVNSAENAASIAGVLYTEASSDDDIDQVEPFDEFDIERGVNITLPAGNKYQQFKSEQPTTIYPAFKRELLREQARPVGLPYNLAVGDSSEYNYSSGRLDHQSFDKQISIERDDIEIEGLDRIFELWMSHASRISGFLPQSARAIDAHEHHQWFWPGLDPVDQVKAAKADEINLENRTATLSDIYSRKGQDWREQIAQVAEEEKLMEQLGITRKAATQHANSGGDDEDAE